MAPKRLGGGRGRWREMVQQKGMLTDNKHRLLRSKKGPACRHRNPNGHHKKLRKVSATHKWAASAPSPVTCPATSMPAPHLMPNLLSFQPPLFSTRPSSSNVHCGRQRPRVSCALCQPSTALSRQSLGPGSGHRNSPQPTALDSHWVLTVGTSPRETRAASKPAVCG